MEEILTLIVKWVFYILVIILAVVLYKISRYILREFRKVQADHKRAMDNYKFNRHDDV